MKILLVFSHERNGELILDNAVGDILSDLPSLGEMISVKRRLREAGYQNVVILNHMVLTD